MSKLNENPKVNTSLEKLSDALRRKGIPTVKSKNYYQSSMKLPYIALGEYNHEKLERIHNRIGNHIYQKNKSFASVVRKMLREFYQNRKGVKSADKIMIVEAPDCHFNIRLVNRGYKLTKPYILKEKLERDDKKGAAPYIKRIDEFNAEFEKFHKFLLSKKGKGGKSKGGDNGGNIIRGVGNALGAMFTEKVNVVHTHYDNDMKSYPMLELQVAPKESDQEALNKVIKIHLVKNERYYKKMAELISKFYAKTEVDSDMRLVIGLPLKHGCDDTHRQWTSNLGVFGLYNMGVMLNNEALVDDYLGEVDEFIKFLD